VIIPAYCEEVGIAHTITSVHEQLRVEGLTFEIIVVDNASTDATVRKVQELNLPEVRVLSNETNRGKGWSVRRGMLDSAGVLRLHCDADCAPSLSSLDSMRDLITAGADVVVGSRLGPGADIGQKQPVLRRVAGSSFQTLCRVILREPTRDRFCGFKLWRASAAEDVFSNLSLEGWTFDAEALALARRLGYGVVETGIVWADREGSRLSMLRVLFPVTRELLAARKNVKRVASARGKEGVDRLGKPVDHVPGESRMTADPD